MKEKELNRIATEKIVFFLESDVKQIYEMESFVKILNSLWPSIIIAKLSILDVFWDPG